MRANKFRAGLSIGNKKAIVTVGASDRTISVRGIRVGMVSQVKTKYPKSMERMVDVEYMRPDCLDMSINRVGFNFTGPLGADVIGCAPSKIGIGDQVVIFVGGRTPFILRPRTSDTFELIADCYVPEFMNGEAFQLESGLENFILV